MTAEKRRWPIALGGCSLAQKQKSVNETREKRDSRPAATNAPSAHAAQITMLGGKDRKSGGSRLSVLVLHEHAFCPSVSGNPAQLWEEFMPIQVAERYLSCPTGAHSSVMSLLCAALAVHFKVASTFPCRCPRAPCAPPRCTLYRLHVISARALGRCEEKTSSFTAANLARS